MKPYSVILTSVGTLLLLASCSRLRPEGAGAPLELFNGRDLEGWGHVLAEQTVPRERVWTVKDGMIVCQGTPLGYLHTQQTFTNFRLEVEYRWAPGAKPGNSGLFSRIQAPPRALPGCVEVQLMHGNAGDVLTLQGLGLATNQVRFFHVAKHELAGDIDGVKKLHDAEAAPGEWNRVDLHAEGSTYTVNLNGHRVNQVTGVPVLPGPIGLQSEGGEIHFRRVTVTPLP